MSNASQNSSHADVSDTSCETPVSSTDEMGDQEVGKDAELIFDLVPWIGTRWRWYDVPYRFFKWSLTSWRRQILPPFARRLLNHGMNFMTAFNQHERNKVQSLGGLRDNHAFLSQARLRQGGVWVVELFPPSQYKALERSLRRNKLGEAYYRRLEEPLERKLRRARDGRGFAWALIGHIVRPGANYLIPDARREDLPSEFDYIELTAVQLGTSVTALVAFFHLSKAGETSLDEVWRGKHAPTLTWQGIHQPRVTDRYFAFIDATQRERMRLHNLARIWLSHRCPGFFASRNKNIHPVIDLNLFDGLDLFSAHNKREVHDSLRALGMDEWRHHRYVSSQMKGTVLIPTYERDGPYEPLRNCWAIAGGYERSMDENECPGYGNKPYAPGTLGQIFNSTARELVLHLAMMAYLSEQRAMYSTSRDVATTRHGRFTAQRASKLSIELLESGLDLPAVAHASEALWKQPHHGLDRIDVQAVPVEPGDPNRKPFDLLEFFGRQRDTGFGQLLKEAESYRTVLSTVAALGASANTARTGQIALAVAIGSMIVAMLALLVTPTSDSSLWSTLIRWLELRI